MTASACLALAMMASCNKQPRSPAPLDETPTTREGRRLSGPPRVVFEVAGSPAVNVEVVRHRAEIRRGLMHRSYLAENAGMLFLFRREKVQTFYMKNTLISLDMIFIRADRTVAGVRANTPPLTLDSQSVETPSQFVLEVNAGWAAKHGVSAGVLARFENVGDVPPGVPLIDSAP